MANHGSSGKSMRRSERVPTDFKVHWIRRGVAVPAVASDVNAHGVFVRTDVKAEVGELLQLVLHLPDGLLHACVITRFVGTTQGGRGIGTELFVVADGERRRWARFYRSLQRGQAASNILRGELPV